MSTAFYFQTDSQTEKTNQSLEQYLQYYINYKQTNWVCLLLVAQFAWCSALGKILKTTPFYTNYSIEPQLYRKAKEISSIAEYTRIDIKQIKDLYNNLVIDIKFFVQQIAFYTNRKCLEGPWLKKGDKVYFLQQNIKTTRPNNKLDYKKLGLFVVEQVIRPVNYKLRLPEHIQIHPVFYILLLELALANIKIIASELLTQEDNQEYKVEQVIDYKNTDNSRQYLIK